MHASCNVITHAIDAICQARQQEFFEERTLLEPEEAADEIRIHRGGQACMQGVGSCPAQGG